jgi:hypothetical protein
VSTGALMVNNWLAESHSSVVIGEP